MTHPSESELALLAGGDLSLWQRIRLGRHAHQCPQCGAEVEAFRAARRQMSDAAQSLPADIAWGRLAAEMKANIRLGLEAGECVAAAPAPARHYGWRLSAAMASVMMVVLSGWWLQLPAPRMSLVASGDVSGVVLEATSAGLEMKENGRALTLVHASGEPVTLSAGAQGSLRARYFDPETDQVTIHHVYAQ